LTQPRAEESERLMEHVDSKPLVPARQGRATDRNAVQVVGSFIKADSTSHSLSRWPTRPTTNAKTPAPSGQGVAPVGAAQLPRQVHPFKSRPESAQLAR